MYYITFADFAFVMACSFLNRFNLANHWSDGPVANRCEAPKGNWKTLMPGEFVFHDEGNIYKEGIHEP